MNYDIDHIFKKTFQLAKSHKHEYILLEHLLFILLQEPNCIKTLKSCDIKIDTLKKNLEEFLDSKVQKMSKAKTPKETLALTRTIERALLHNEFSSSENLEASDLLVSIFAEDESHAYYLLNDAGATKFKILQVLTDHAHEKINQAEGINEDNPSESILEKYCSNLNALTDKFNPLIGREKEVQRIIQILSRKNKNNPILVGAQGVGKTAIIEGLASKINEKDIPKRLENKTIYSLNVGMLLAGTKFRGDFESRLEKIVKELRENKDSILFIDEIHMLIGAGATSGTTVDASNLLKPVLTEDGFACIGSTTFEEYKRIFEKDRALARRFMKVNVNQPSIEETIEILNGIKPSLENFHNVKYSNESIEKAAELSDKYIHDRFLPDKAIDLVDEAGANISLKGEKNTVDIEDIENAIESTTKIPKQTISNDQKDLLNNLDFELKQNVFGQDIAIDNLCAAIKRSKAGLARDDRPIGCFLFSGPTGVGKTEVAKQLSRVLGVELSRFDMSEYMEKHSVARLIGAPPGYVGHEQGGLLTDEVLKNPSSVILLDEIEKAHPDLFNILLQVMDNASLTDSTGKRADFRNTIIIMTSNVGSEQHYSDAIGFGNKSKITTSKAVEKKFRPEFINRLDLIVNFNALDKEMMKNIVNKFFTEISNKLKAKNISLKFNDEVINYFVENGFSSKYGARQAHRLIEKELTNKIADHIIDQSVKSQFEIVLHDGKVSLKAS